MQLTQKETSLLKDLKDQEKLCEEKYRKHAAAASDPQLKNLFSRLAQTEKAHYDMLVQMEQRFHRLRQAASSRHFPQLTNLRTPPKSKTIVTFAPTC